MDLQNDFGNQSVDEYEMKHDGIDEKYSESTLDSPHSSAMSESVLEQAHSTFFPSKQGSSRSRGFVVSYMFLKNIK